MRDYSISGSIVVYNKPDDAYKTVESVKIFAGDMDLYIIDNDSRENIGRMLEKHFDANYINMGYNAGFGKAHNRVLDKINSK